MARGTLDTRARSAMWAAYAVAAFSLLFAAAHLYWILGGRAGIDLSADPAFRRPWLFAFDLVADVVFLVSWLIALATLRTSGRVLSRWLLILAWCSGAVLALRGGVGLALDVYLAMFQTRFDMVTSLFDLWFLIEGALLGVMAWSYARRHSSAIGAHASRE